jgi:two-component system, chemotaxis family, protein-glutamate methylesterase/glutaminase
MLPSRTIRVLVVDDTIVYRKAVSDIVEEIPCAELAGVAHNGKIAIAKIASLKPDLLTLDIEMPVMNGIEVLQEIRRQKLDVGVIMLSTLTAEGSDMTMRALELGAFDFLLKPQQSANLTAGKRQLKELLQPMIEAFTRSRIASGLLSGRTNLQRPVMSRGIEAAGTAPRRVRPVTPAPTRTAERKTKSEIVVIGVSTGGPNALGQMLPGLPGDLGVPILIVQHMPPVFTRSLAASLDKKCRLTVKEATEREPLQPNIVYIAPGGKQMKIIAAADGTNRIVKITDDPPENSCKPSVDYLFRSIGDYYVNRATAVIMTGMGSDGTKGLQILKSKGTRIIAQNEDTCVVFGMPKAPIELGLADVVAPLNKIADEIIKTVKN